MAHPRSVSLGSARRVKDEEKINHFKLQLAALSDQLKTEEMVLLGQKELDLDAALELKHLQKLIVVCNELSHAPISTIWQFGTSLLRIIGGLQETAEAMGGRGGNLFGIVNTFWQQFEEMKKPKENKIKFFDLPRRLSASLSKNKRSSQKEIEHPKSKELKRLFEDVREQITLFMEQTKAAEFYAHTDALAQLEEWADLIKAKLDEQNVCYDEFECRLNVLRLNALKNKFKKIIKAIHADMLSDAQQEINKIKNQMHITADLIGTNLFGTYSDTYAGIYPPKERLKSEKRKRLRMAMFKLDERDIQTGRIEFCNEFPKELLPGILYVREAEDSFQYVVLTPAGEIADREIKKRDIRDDVCTHERNEKELNKLKMAILDTAFSKGDVVVGNNKIIVAAALEGKKKLAIRSLHMDGESEYRTLMYWSHSIGYLTNTPPPYEGGLDKTGKRIQYYSIKDYCAHVMKNLNYLTNKITPGIIFNIKNLDQILTGKISPSKNTTTIGLTNIIRLPMIDRSLQRAQFFASDNDLPPVADLNGSNPAESSPSSDFWGSDVSGARSSDKSDGQQKPKSPRTGLSSR